LISGLLHVHKLGWSQAALQAGAHDLGFPATLSGIVPEADIGLVHHHFKVSNENMEVEMAKQVNTGVIRRNSER
jgi:ubiquinone biosynthesis protein COQ9